MRIPIPTIQRQIAPQAANAGPMASGVPASGLEDLGASLFNVGANMQQAANIEADRAAREAAEKLARSEHEQRKNRVMERSRDDRLKWQETMQRRQTEAPEGADGFTASALKDFDTYREEALKTVSDPEERAMYDGMLGSLRESVGEKALVFQAGARTAYRAKSLTEGVEKSARLVTVDPSQMPDVLAQELALIRSSSDLTAEQKATLAERAKDTLSWAAAQTLVDRNPDAFLERVGVRGGKPGKDGTPPKQDIEKAAAAVQGDAVLSQLPPARLQQAIERATTLSINRKAQAQMEADRARARAEAEANKREREAGAAYTVLRDMALAGRKIDMTDPENRLLMDQMMRVPAYAHAYTENLAQAPANAATAQLPLAQQQAQLDALYVQRNTKGFSKGLEAEIKRVEGVIAANKKGYANDPLQNGADVGVLPSVAPMDTSSFDTIMRDLPARVEQTRAVTVKSGAAHSPFRPSEAPAIEKMFAAWSPAQQAEAVGRLAGVVPTEQLVELSKQIDPKNKALALAMKAGNSRTTQGRYTAELLLAGAKKFADTKAGDAGAKGDSARQQLRSDVANYIDGDKPGMGTISGQTREELIDAAIYINAGLETLGSKAGAERAASLAVGGSGFETHAGKRIPIPAGQTYDQFRGRITSYPTSDLTQKSDKGVFYGAGKMTVDQLRAELPTMPLQPAGGGMYYVRSGAGLVRGANGAPLLLNLN